MGQVYFSNYDNFMEFNVNFWLPAHHSLRLSGQHKIEALFMQADSVRATRNSKYIAIWQTYA